MKFGSEARAWGLRRLWGLRFASGRARSGTPPRRFDRMCRAVGSQTAKPYPERLRFLAQ